MIQHTLTVSAWYVGIREIRNQTWRLAVAKHTTLTVQFMRRLSVKLSSQISIELIWQTCQQHNERTYVLKIATVSAAKVVRSYVYNIRAHFETKRIMPMRCWQLACLSATAARRTVRTSSCQAALRMRDSCYGPVSSQPVQCVQLVAVRMHKQLWRTNKAIVAETGRLYSIRCPRRLNDKLNCPAVVSSNIWVASRANRRGFNRDPVWESACGTKAPPPRCSNIPAYKRWRIPFNTNTITILLSYSQIWPP